MLTRVKNMAFDPGISRIIKKTMISYKIEKMQNQDQNLQCRFNEIYSAIKMSGYQWQFFNIFHPTMKNILYLYSFLFTLYLYMLYRYIFQSSLKVFFAIIKAKLIAFQFQYFAQLWRATEKHSYFSLLLSRNFFEDFVPIWSSSIGSGFQTSNQISFGLKNQIKKQVKNYLF